MPGSWATPTYSLVTPNCRFKTVAFVWTADAAAATVPDLAFSTDVLNFCKGYFIHQIQTYPGATQPTNLYDVYLKNAAGIDILAAGLENRSATAGQITTVLTIPIDETLTWSVANNAVNSATATIKLYLTK